MIKFFAFVFYYIPLFLAWVYFLVSAYCVVNGICRLKIAKRQSALWWMLLIFNMVYFLSFLILRIFFKDIWRDVFGFIGIGALCIGYIFGSYEEKCKGRRPWYWYR